MGLALVYIGVSQRNRLHRSQHGERNERRKRKKPREEYCICWIMCMDVVDSWHKLSAYRDVLAISDVVETIRFCENQVIPRFAAFRPY